MNLILLHPLAKQPHLRQQSIYRRLIFCRNPRRGW